jgi:RNA polymerase sigma-70 factor (ECF subfamily)
MLAGLSMTSDPSDAELVRRLAAGGLEGRAAETLLFRRFARRIELYGVRHLGNRETARDFVHEVLLRVTRSIREGRVDEPERLCSFVLGTCRLVSFDWRRAEQRQRNIEREAGHVAAALGPVEAPNLSEQDVVRLFRCLGALPEREASVVRMSFFEDREADEISQRLGISSGNVRVVRCRALAKLAQCMHAGASS